MKEWIKDNLITIVIYVYIFLVGVGVGGAITDMIWGMKDEKRDKTRYERLSDTEKVRKDGID